MSIHGDIISNKHHNNPASSSAYERGHGRHARRREIIYALLEESHGMTSKEIASCTGWALNTFSGRLSELKRDGKVRGTGEMRLGAEVLEVVRTPKQMSLLEAS